MTEKQAKLSRRNFLLTVGAGGAATAAAVVAAKKHHSPQHPAKASVRRVGYHATEHINNYYRTTKV